ncbi:PRDX1 [Lepeophtheirus salmonis]|uniref:thioredoxin-dependent peroxiredoxin n=1 Tax=Lepeophtheirus salmonis TaxID=72036 RepID=A0A7R8H3Z0_LEPSM|nr:PRDX1 [Lepeophtheirus salmonis]CAF2841790.1 PRDX1 [Lepeophtheirus salmonis]
MGFQSTNDTISLKTMAVINKKFIGVPTEIIAFGYRPEDFRKIGYEGFTCSTESHFLHLHWVNTFHKERAMRIETFLLLWIRSMKFLEPMLCSRKTMECFSEDFSSLTAGNQKLRQITINDRPVGRCVEETFRFVLPSQ